MNFGSDIPFWESIGFHERLLTWMDSESPDPDLIAVVVSWIDRQTNGDPFRGVRRQTAIASNLWWGRIPGTAHDGKAVFCSYWVFEEMRQIRCDSISTLNC